MNGGDGPVFPFTGGWVGSEGTAIATSLLADWWWLWIPYLVVIVVVRLCSEVAGLIACGLMFIPCGVLLVITVTGDSPQVALIGVGLMAAAVVVTGVTGMICEEVLGR